MVETPGPEPETPLEHVRLTIGTITGVHGVRGELKLRLTADDPAQLSTIKRVYLDDEAKPRRVRGFRLHAGQALLRLAGVDDPESGRQLIGQPVRIAGSDAPPLAPGEYFLYQLIGLDVFDEAGNRLGRVTDLIETGANDVFVVTNDDGQEILLPHHASVVQEIDPAARRMIVRPLRYEGDEAAPS